MSKARLEGTNLSNCNLSKANLSHADLKGANLKGANLHQAKLEGVTLPFQTLDVTANLGDLCDYYQSDAPLVFAIRSESAALRLRAVKLRYNHS